MVGPHLLPDHPSSSLQRPAPPWVSGASVTRCHPNAETLLLKATTSRGALAARPVAQPHSPEKPARAATHHQDPAEGPHVLDQVQDGAGHQGHQLRRQESGDPPHLYTHLHTHSHITCTHTYTHTSPVHTPRHHLYTHLHTHPHITCTHTYTHTPPLHTPTPTHHLHTHITCTHTQTSPVHTPAHTPTHHLHTCTPTSPVPTPTPTLTLSQLHTPAHPHPHPRTCADASTTTGEATMCRALAHTAHWPTKAGLEALEKGQPGGGQSALGDWV